ncbi:MAG: YcxB family protein [Burkholderiaceae bacterium]
MDYRATLFYTPSLVRQSVWAFWRRTVGITLSLTQLLLTAYLVVVIREGNIGWLVGVFGTLVALGYAYLVALFVVRWRLGMASLRAMGSPEATLEFNEEGFSLRSGAGQMGLPWRSVREVWCYPGYWMLLISPSQYLTIPLDNLSMSMQDAMLAFVRAHGGRTR